MINLESLSHSLLQALEGLSGTVIGLLAAGGPIVGILVLCSIFALAIIVAKLWQFWKVRIGDHRTAQKALALYRANDFRHALSLAEKSSNPVAKVLAYALRGRQRSDSDEARIREEIVRYARDMLERLRSYLKPLEVIATLAPLLGLLGTVLGMIEAFQQLEGSGNQIDPAILSGGIWEALMTTAVGLAVAIPTVAALSWLDRTIERTGHEMDNIVTQVFTLDLMVEPQPDLRGHHHVRA